MLLADVSLVDVREVPLIFLLERISDVFAYCAETHEVHQQHEESAQSNRLVRRLQVSDIPTKA
jgi:hypothetical protein